jgi:hypothetical protein
MAGMVKSPHPNRAERRRLLREKMAREKSQTASSGGASPPSSPPVSAPTLDPPPPPPDPNIGGWERFFRILENGIVLAVMGIAGSLAGAFVDGRYFLLLIIPVVLGTHRSGALKDLSPVKSVVACLAIVILSGYVFWELGIKTNESRSQLIRDISTAISGIIHPKSDPPPPDPKYPAPKGPLVRMEGQVEQASISMCQGMSEAERIACLCPSPLQYSLRALDPPNDNNYSTEIDIRKSNRPFYRLRIFARTTMEARYGYSLAPPIGEHSSAALGIMTYDPFSLTLTSSAPEDEFKIQVHTAEGLRLWCVNQEN